MQFESHKAFQKWGENIESFRTLTAATIRAEKAAKMTQRSRATNCHIRPSARHKVTGLAKYLTSTSSEKLHQFPPGKIDGRNSKNFLSLSCNSKFSSLCSPSNCSTWPLLAMENPLIEEDLRGHKRRNPLLRQKSEVENRSLVLAAGRMLRDRRFLQWSEERKWRCATALHSSRAMDSQAMKSLKSRGATCSILFFSALFTIACLWCRRFGAN